ncbi:MAG: hypothetical protein KGZ93_04545 [Actinobacteria bacterium]|nr:hypothetical protein [Actinomycetota bacterium]
MKKALVIMMALALLFAMGGMALAKQEPATTDPSTPGNIVASDYDLTLEQNNNPAKRYGYFERGIAVTSGAYTGSTPNDTNKWSTHVYGTWNSPYTTGVDGYNYNDAQDYIAGGDQVSRITGSTVTTTTALADFVFQSGPHGGYLTSTHRCRECHAVHRAAGKFKLLRSDTRFEACDWCHGTGAGSGYNIQMDNDDAYTTEYNVGHTMGFGISTGKWKAPDDTYPAFTPNYWQGGFSCFDCHSPHANPARMLGFDKAGQPVGIRGKLDGKVYGVLNSGSGGTWDKALKAANNPQGMNKPFWPSGTWLLIKNPDREIASTTTIVKSGIWKPKAGSSLNGTSGDENLTLSQFIAKIAEPEKDITITAGQEIDDAVTESLFEFDGNTSYPVNKMPIDWNSPLGTVTKSLWRASAANGGGITASYAKSTGEAVGLITEKVRRADAQGAWTGTGDYTEPNNVPCTVWTVSEFCTDCHDGNAGLHTVKAPLFSEDRALRNQGNNADGTSKTGAGNENFRGNYDLAYGHDTQPRHCGRQMVFNPEDGQNFGPHCRNCHKGSSRCSVCHDAGAYTGDPTLAADNTKSNSLYSMARTTLVSTPTADNPLGSDRNLVSPAFGPGPNSTLGYFQKSRTTNWDSDWRNATGAVAMGKISGDVSCADDGFSWPHRTLGFKMLKDDLFGLDFTGGKVINVGDIRKTYDGKTTNSAGLTLKAHDLDSVCLDCHNPTVWNATSASDHIDSPTLTTDNHDDELLTRGLP